MPLDRQDVLRKRQLRAEIARTRAETIATIGALRDERRRLTSWRTYVGRFPIASLGLAFGVGLWIAAFRPGRRLPGLVSGNLLRWGLQAARSGIINDLKTAFLSTPSDPDSR